MKYPAGFKGMLLCLLVLGLSGCGACGSGDDAGDGGGAGAARAKIDVCGGLGVERAADLLGVANEDVVEEVDPERGLCGFSSRSDPGKALAYSVTHLDGETEAARFFEGMTAALGKISPLEPVAGLGDAAVQAPGPKARRLLLRKGATVIDLFEPTDPELQRQAMAVIAGGL